METSAMVARAETVQASLRRATERLRSAGIAHAEREAMWLFEHALQTSRVQVVLDADRTLTQPELTAIDRVVRRRAGREPLQYVLGSEEFCGLELVVSPAVLIPRPETEGLVEAVVTNCVTHRSPMIADVGTGSGCVAIASAVALPEAALVATDLSLAALDMARSNAVRHGVGHRIEFLEGDLLTAIPAARVGTFDAIVSNPPYIAAGEFDGLQPEVARYEPRLALAGGPDGLAILRRLAVESWRWLKVGGLLAVEVGAGQAGPVRELVLATGHYGDRETRRDQAGIERVVCFTRQS